MSVPTRQTHVHFFERLDEILGRQGRIMSESKMAYRDAHPGHQIFFNANVYDELGNKLWFGDIDLDRRVEVPTSYEEPLEMNAGELLQTLADDYGVTIYVTPEMPWRFEESQVTLARRLKDSDKVVKFQPQQTQER